MASKLDYLKKYLAKPPGQSISDAAGSSSKSSAVKAVKEKLRSKTRRPLEQNTLRIRDLSDTLPAPKAAVDDTLRLGRRGDAGFGGSLAERPDEEAVFVDAEEVVEKSKVEHETSGVAWKISQHRGSKASGAKFPPVGAALRRAAAADSDDDLSPRRLPSGLAREAASRSSEDVEPAFRPSKKSSAASSIPRRSEIKGRAESDHDDLSPPRGRPPASSARGGEGRKGEAGGERGGGGAEDSDDDLSPLRTAPAVKKEEDKVKMEPCDSDDDLSPPRPGGAAESMPLSHRRSKTLRAAVGEKKIRGKDEEDKEKGKKNSARHDSDSDFSPPRNVKTEEVKTEAESDNDLSPPRSGCLTTAKKQPGSDDDLSPPRRAPRPADSYSRRAGSHGDLSPPRQAPGPTCEKTRAQAAGSDDDLSPPRAPKAAQTKEKEDPARASGRHDSDSDLSPPRQDPSSKVGLDGQTEEDAPKMSSGLRAGLVKGGDLKAETAKVRAEHRAAVLAAPDDQTGRNASTVYRSKTGAKIAREEWVEQQQKKKRKKLSEYPEQELEWGGGVKQKHSREEDMAETERIAAQPFARFEPDQKYMEELKERQDWNDPMRKFESDQDVAAQPAANQQQAKPKCPHAPWPNRFNILPGYRWDGAVRGNGFEKKWLETKNHRDSKQAARWKWEMEEM